MLVQACCDFLLLPKVRFLTDDDDDDWVFRSHLNCLVNLMNTIFTGCGEEVRRKDG